jgi:hypothetical protein
MLIGRLALRGCPRAGRPCAHTHCHLRAFCRCAQADTARAARVENRFWLAVIGASTLALVLWFTAY